MNTFPRIDLTRDAPRRKFTMVDKEVHAQALFHLVAPGIKLHFLLPDVPALQNWNDFEEYLREEEVERYRELLHSRRWSDDLGDLCMQAVIAAIVKHKAW